MQSPWGPGERPTQRELEAARTARRAQPRLPGRVRYTYVDGVRYTVHDADLVVGTDGRYEGFRDDHIRQGGDNILSPVQYDQRRRSG